MMQTSDLFNELPATPVRHDGTTAVELNGVYWRIPNIVISDTVDTIMVVQMPYSYEHMVRVMNMVDPNAGAKSWAMGQTETLPNQSNLFAYFAWFDGWDNDARRIRVLLGLHGMVRWAVGEQNPTRSSFSAATRRILYSNAMCGAYLVFQFGWYNSSTLVYRIVPNDSIPPVWRQACRYPLSNHLLGGTSGYLSAGLPVNYGSLLTDVGGSGDLHFGQFYSNPQGTPSWDLDHYRGFRLTSGGYTYHPAVAHGARVVQAEMVVRDDWMMS